MERQDRFEVYAKAKEYGFIRNNNFTAEEQDFIIKIMATYLSDYDSTDDEIRMVLRIIDKIR